MKTRHLSSASVRSLAFSGSALAFTLLEVIVACAVFFMVAFAVLQLVTQGLVAARSLQRREPDIAIVLAMLSTNKSWVEETISGSYEDIAPGMYPGYRWEAFPMEVGSNGLWEVKVISHNERKAGQNPTTATALFFAPMSKPGSATKGRP